MRKIFSFHAVSVDGYHEGPNHELDWHVVDDEFNQFAIDQIGTVDTLMFGRRTYTGMASYWPTPQAEQDDPKVAELMNGLPKIVVSRTLDTADWSGTRIVRDLAELAEIRREPGGDIVIMGSSALVVELMAAGLLDEVRIMVMPVLLGAGRSLFHTAARPAPMTLLGTRAFASGNVLLTYQPLGH